MAKSKIDKDDIKRLVENTSNPSSTTSVYSAKYVDDNFLKEVTKEAIEAVLTGVITSHQHNYATSSQGDKADTAIQGVSVNNTELTSDDNKKVNITVPTTVAELSDSNEYAHLSNGKILEGNLPDYIFGQVLFGGFIAINTSTNKLVCTLSAKFKSKYNITENTLLLENMPADTYEGVFFMATNSWNTPPNDGQVGDWIISNGITWSKVDNTDAVSSVNGQTGAVVLTHADVGAASSNHTHNYESLTDIPENISMGEFVLSEVNLENITETCIYPLQYGHKYYSVPNKFCGTDEVKEDLEGFLFVYKKNDIVSQQLHDTINNILYIRSFNRISEEWSLWKRLLTCVDEIIEDLEETEEFSYEIGSSYQRISLNGNDIKGRTILIDLKNFNSQISAKLRIVIFISPASANPDIQIIDSSSPAKPINYSLSYYTAPSSVSSNVYLIEYEIFNLITGWLVSNKIYY